MKKVGFICVHNSCRSQIAEALGKHFGCNTFESYSAGTELRPCINQQAVRLIREIYGIDMEQTQRPKLLDDIPALDIVVTMGCNVSCPTLPCSHREDWGLDDPSHKSDEIFRETIAQIELKIKELIDRLSGGFMDLKKLTKLQCEVTQNEATEPPYDNEFWDFYEDGIYLDIVTDEPLFSSKDKFPCHGGWASFAKPISEALLEEHQDTSFNRIRTEVKSSKGKSHLGHVFDDGPTELGGLRYCINSAALRFIAKSDLEKEGFGEYFKLFDK